MKQLLQEEKMGIPRHVVAFVRLRTIEIFVTFSSWKQISEGFCRKKIVVGQKRMHNGLKHVHLQTNATSSSSTVTFVQRSSFLLLCDDHEGKEQSLKQPLQVQEGRDKG